MNRRQKLIIVLLSLVAIVYYFYSLLTYKQTHYESRLYPKFRDISSEFPIIGNPINRNETEIKDFPKDYRINTNGCKISDLPLFTAQTQHLFENDTKSIIECDPNVINIRRINGTFLQFDWSALDYRPFCYYRQLSRGRDDFHNTYGGLNGPVTDPVLDLPDFEAVHIMCRKIPVNNTWNTILFLLNNRRKDTDLIHNEVIPLIPRISKSSDSGAPNVLLLAIDSTSYVNFKRHFIRTEKLLNKHKFFELKGYNKVGANTFPNMIPFFTGRTSEELVSDEALQKITFDDWPLIWRKYSDKGFVTAFVEEMPQYGLFVFNRKGFKGKPTDYYTRPFQMELEKDTNNKFCYKNKAEFELVLDYTYDFVKLMNERQQKYFAYISVSEMTHDWLNAAHYMDVPYHQLLSKLLDEDLVKDTLIIFFSDHGLRTGEFRRTLSGEMENRLPFMFIKMHKSVEKPLLDNLRQNQLRLSTPYDIHATLTHLIEGRANHTLPHGLSLIDGVITGDRDCAMAAIPETFCGCYQVIPVFDSRVIQPEITVNTIVKEINKNTEKYRSICAELEFKAIDRIYKRDDGYKGDQDHPESYLIQLYTTPGMGLFETVVRRSSKYSDFEVIGNIIRINKYGDQSHCVPEKSYKEFCFCRDLLPTKARATRGWGSWG